MQPHTVSSPTAAPLASNSTTPSSPHDPYFNAPVQFVSTGQNRIAYRTIGSGPPVLFIHGWPLSASTFRDVAPLIAKRHRCIIIDLPGSGLSAAPAKWHAPFQQHADAVVDFIDALDLTDLAVVAHDSGGTIARLVAAIRPDRIASLCLGNTEIPGHTPKLLKLYSGLLSYAPFRRAFGVLLNSSLFLRSNFGFGTCFADPNFIDGSFREAALVPLQDRAKLDVLMRMIGDLDWEVLTNLAAVQKKIVCPVRLIWGPHDPFFPLKHADRIGATLPNFEKLVVLPDGKLFAHEEFPSLFAGHCLDFLDDNATHETPAHVVASSAA